MSLSISWIFMALNLVSCYLVILLNFPLSNKGRITAEPPKVSSLLKSTQLYTASSYGIQRRFIGMFLQARKLLHDFVIDKGANVTAQFLLDFLHLISS